MKSNTLFHHHYTKEIDEKKAILTRQNLLSMILFLVVSIWAYIFKDFHLCEEVPIYLKTVLGAPPPAYLVSLSLVGYFFSTLVLTLFAITKNLEPKPQWGHLGYRLAFFGFYAMSGAIAPNFMPVLLLGLLLYALDEYHIWAYNFIIYLLFIHPTAVHFVGVCEAAY